VSWTLKQTPNTGGNQALTVSATWGSTTTSGSLLVACVGCGYSGSGTYTAPSGWTPIPILNNVAVNLQWFYIPNSAPRSGAESWTFSGTISGDNGVTIVLMEWTPAGGTYDSSASPQTNTGTSTSTLTTASLTPSVAGELILAGYSAYDSSTKSSASFSAPTNSYVLAGQVNAGANPGAFVSVNALGVYYLTPAGASATSSGVTFNLTATDYVSSIISFEPAPLALDEEGILHAFRRNW
jgi:hypothetical protein